MTPELPNKISSPDKGLERILNGIIKELRALQPIAGSNAVKIERNTGGTVIDVASNSYQSTQSTSQQVQSFVVLAETAVALTCDLWTGSGRARAVDGSSNPILYTVYKPHWLRNNVDTRGWGSPTSVSYYGISEQIWPAASAYPSRRIKTVTSPSTKVWTEVIDPPYAPDNFDPATLTDTQLVYLQNFLVIQAQMVTPGAYWMDINSAGRSWKPEMYVCDDSNNVFAIVDASPTYATKLPTT